MSEAITLHAKVRNDIGKGASRRLRRLHNEVPAIIYGGESKPENISLLHNKLMKAMESEAFYSSMLNVELDGKTQTVIVKDIQRNPYKKQVMHIDLMRVNATDIITKTVPLHFVNEETAVGVKAGGIVSHLMAEVEIKCRADKLPEHIDVDLSAVELDQTLHLTDLKLPSKVELTADLSDDVHNLPVASIHLPKKAVEEEELPTSADVPAENGDSPAEPEAEA